MPDAQAGRCDWPGVEGLESEAEYTYRHGIEPCAAVLAVPITSNPQPVGNLRFYDRMGTGAVSVVLQDCKLDSVVFNFAEGRMKLVILDQRWRWANGLIRGVWNTRDSRGELLKSRKRNLRELAGMCFTKMGVRNYALGTLPFDQYPAVDWQDANPAQALQALISPLDYAVSLSPFTNIPTLVKRGEGRPLPDTIAFTYAAPSVDLPEAPSLIIISGAELEIEMMFRLKAIGLDADNIWREITELSYAPKEGWGHCAPPTYPNLTQLELLPGQKDLPSQMAWLRKLAETVFKCYQVDLSSDVDPNAGAPIVPGYNGQARLRTQEQFSIKNVRVFDAQTPDGYYSPLPAQVSGIFVRKYQVTPGDTDELGNSLHAERVNSGFSVSSGLFNDQFINMVTFSKPMYRRNKDGTIAPADLRLYCAVTLRDQDNLATERYYYGTLNPAQVPAGAVVVKRPDIRRKVITEYKLLNPAKPFESPIWQLDKELDNAPECDRLARIYTAVVQNYYTPVQASEMVYPGIQLIEPDGARQEITWRTGVSRAPETVASYNRRHAFWLPTREERVLWNLVQPKALGEQGILQENVRRSVRDIQDLPDKDKGIEGLA
jgi:hypothetical protein